MLSILVATGCGRIGFDPLATVGDGGLDAAAAIDADPSTLDAAVNLTSRTLVGAGRDSVSDIAIDSSGNIFISGYFEETIDFGDGQRTAQGSRDAFVASYDSNLQLRWAKSWGAAPASRAEAHALALDGDSRLWATGEFADKVDFGAGELASAGAGDIFLIRMDPSDGAVVRSSRFGSAGDDDAKALKVDAAGNVVFAGEIRGPTDFGGGLLTHMGTSSIVVASFGPGGVYRWAKRYGELRFNAARALSLDGYGNSYVSGLYEGNPDFGDGPSPYRGIQDAFLLSFDINGVFRWSTTWGSSGFDFAEGSVNDAAGNVYVSGYVSGLADVPGGPNIGGAGQRDAYLLSYTAAGVFRWAKSYGGSGCDRGRGVAIGPTGQIYQTGYFTGDVSFDATLLQASADRDAFIVRTDASGVQQAATRLGGLGDDHGKAMAITGAGQAYLVANLGEITNACDTTSPTEGDVFISKVD